MAGSIFWRTVFGLAALSQVLALPAHWAEVLSNTTAHTLQTRVTPPTGLTIFKQTIRDCHAIHVLKVFPPDSNEPVEWKLRYFNKGADGCIYILLKVGRYGNLVERRWHNGERVLIKILRVPATPQDGGFEEPNEVAVLAKLGEPYPRQVVRIDGFGDHWVIMMQRHEGKFIAETSAWMSLFPFGVNYLPIDASPLLLHKCNTLLDGVHQLNIDTLLDIAKNKGVVHMDFHYGNLLFTENLDKVTPIDWGRSKVLRDDETLDEVEIQLITQTVPLLQLPKTDAVARWPADPENRLFFFPGICSSESRKNGEPTLPPFGGSPQVATNDQIDRFYHAPIAVEAH